MASKAFNWGRAIAHNNFQEFGELGNAKSDKAYSTCQKYANDKSIKRTHKGVVLTEQLRALKIDTSFSLVNFPVNKKAHKHRLWVASSVHRWRHDLRLRMCTPST